MEVKNNSMKAMLQGTQSESKAQGAEGAKGKKAAKGQDKDAQEFAGAMAQASLGISAQAREAFNSGKTAASAEGMAEKGAEQGMKQAKEALADSFASKVAAEKLEGGLQKQDAQRALRLSEIEKSPLTMKPAASMSTAAAIAGLKPWSADWVFQGGEELNPELRTLLDAAKGGDAAAAFAKNAAVAGESAQGAMAEKLEALQAEIQKVSANSGLMMPDQGVEAAPEGEARPASYSELSGSDFIDMLKMRGGNQQGANSGSQGFSKDGEIGGGNLLKLIQGGRKPEDRKSFGDRLDAVSAGMMQQPLGGEKLAAPMSEITGHVTQGAMTRERLSTEALMNVSTQIRESAIRGGGEIRIRLKPENLGELHLKIATSGQDVSLSIHASDVQAKKIIEESLAHLKESLVKQNLTLGKVDVSVLQPGASSAGDQMAGNHQQSGQNGFDSMGLMQDGNQGRKNGSGESRSDGSESGSSTRLSAASSAGARVASAQAATAAGASRSASASGRLNVIA